MRSLALVLALAACAPATVTTTPAPAARAAETPTAIRWTRTSAEHRAAFLQTYALATRELERLAAGLPAGSWAVISDADETLIDNSTYQRERARVDSAFTAASWDAWVRRREATALPGAVAFAARVRALGGRLAVVTNRNEDQCEATRANMVAVGITPDVVLCQPAGAPGDKNPRFAQVASGAGDLPPLRVLMWVGDNIRDFPQLDQPLRAQGAEAFADFGRRFWMLPNPMYGSWERNPDR
jgi:5'-nucleotidase (lipoprotein e(P4) family)